MSNTIYSHTGKFVLADPTYFDVDMETLHGLESHIKIIDVMNGKWNLYQTYVTSEDDEIPFFLLKHESFNEFPEFDDKRWEFVFHGKMESGATGVYDSELFKLNSCILDMSENEELEFLVVGPEDINNMIANNENEILNLLNNEIKKTVPYGYYYAYDEDTDEDTDEENNGVSTYWTMKNDQNIVIGILMTPVKFDS